MLNLVSGTNTIGSRTSGDRILHIKMNESLEQLIENKSFLRFVRGDADEEEMARWNQWIREDPHHEELYEEAVFFLQKFHIESRIETDDAGDWDEIEQLIRSDEERLHQLPSHQRENTAKLLLRYAAIIFIITIAGISYWLISNSRSRYDNTSKTIADVTIQTGFSELKTINIPGGSQIILAPNSKILHKQNWLDKPLKKLKLTGEAYFNISDKNKKSGKAEFEITTQQGIVRDYGTRFNVSTFDNKTVVVLEHGKVSVSKVVGEKSSTVLGNGQMALISDQASGIDIKKVNTRVYTSWRTKTLYFDNTPLSFFLSYLTNFYGLKVVVRDSTLMDKRLSDGIDRGSVKNMLNVISHVLNIKMYQNGDTVYVQGSPELTH